MPVSFSDWGENWWKEINAWATIWDNTVCDLIVGFNHHTCIIQTHNSLYYKYNAISAVVYYNLQSILVSFPINMGVFSGHRFLAWVAFSLHREMLHIRCNIGAQFAYMYIFSLYLCLQPLSSQASGICIRQITCAYVTTTTHN